MNKLISTILATVFLSCLTITPTHADTEKASLSEPEVQFVSLNLADESVLASLKGVGHKKALAIIAFREKNGNFTKIDELLKVKGIGKHVLAKNKHRLKI